jgi:hypothetical protein
MKNMKFRFSAIFSQVGISFKISHKAVKLIWYELEEKVDLSDLFVKKYKDYTLVFIYSAREQNDFAVMEAIISKRYKVVEYVIKMPYREIQSDPKVYDVFLIYLEKGIREIFEKYEIEQKELHSIFQNVREKVIDNPEFRYIET